MTRTPDPKHPTVSPREIRFHIARAHQLRAEAFGDLMRWIGLQLFPWAPRRRDRRPPAASCRTATQGLER
jgi:hypothetical protein